MAPKAKPFRPLVLGRSLTLSGGFVPGKSFVLEDRNVEFICGGGATAGGHREKLECLLISIKEPWLCEIATGQAVYHRPLSRVTILRQLKELVAGGSSQPDAQMAAVAFADSDQEQMDSPVKNSKKTKDKQTKQLPSVWGQTPPCWYKCRSRGRVRALRFRFMLHLMHVGVSGCTWTPCPGSCST